MPPTQQQQAQLSAQHNCCTASLTESSTWQRDPHTQLSLLRLLALLLLPPLLVLLLL